MILLIDNYDSFSYNLYQLVGTINPDIKVIRNDEMTPSEIEALHPSHLIISPGPGKPSQAGYSKDIIAHFQGKVPILGVCLGHQAIGEVYGATVSYAKDVFHGKPSQIEVIAADPLLAGLPKEFQGARYHSLAVLAETLPACLTATSQTTDGEIMSLRHTAYDVYGLQFHPESILTSHGEQILRNFLAL